MATQDLNILAEISNTASSGDTDTKSAPSNVPDYGIKLVDVVLNSNNLKVVLDTSEGQEPPTTDKPYKKVDITLTYQELPNGEVFILSKPHMETLAHPTIKIDLSLISPAIPESENDYKIGVSVTAENYEGDMIQFNNSEGGMNFEADKTVSLNTN